MISMTQCHVRKIIVYTATGDEIFKVGDEYARMGKVTKITALKSLGKITIQFDSGEYIDFNDLPYAIFYNFIKKDE